MEKSLEFYAGVGGGTQSNHKTIRVDNGDDISGKNATGQFVCKTGRKGDFKREKFGKKMEVIVLVQRARIKMDGEWYSEEFNPLDSFELVKLHSEKDTKKVKKYFYSQIQEKFPKIPGRSGQMTNPFKYETVLYIKSLTHDTTFRIILSGKTMRKWIDFKSGLDMDSLWMTSINMEVVKDTDGFYTIEFSQGEKLEYTETRSIVEGVMSGLPQAERDETKQLEEGVQPDPEEEIPTIEPEEIEELDNEIEKAEHKVGLSPAEKMKALGKKKDPADDWVIDNTKKEEDEDDDEIKVEDIPF